MTVEELQRQWKNCKGNLECETSLETLFRGGGGTIGTDPNQPGGKVFTDKFGGKVFIKGAP